MNIHSLLFLSSILLSFYSCKEAGPQPSSMVGIYNVTVSLEPSTFDKAAIKDSIKNAFKEAEAEIEKARNEMDKELNLDAIDTSNLEGKLEYLAKSFGKSMGEIGLNIGNLGKDFGSLISEVTSHSLDFSESFLKNLSFEIELQADGDIKNTDNSIVSFGLQDAKWRVDGDSFYITKSRDKEEDVFLIKDKNSNGFVIQKDKVLINFVKK